MADIFQEVDEEVRRERLKQFWDRYGGLVMAVAVVIVLGVGGWRGYHWWEAKKAAEAGAVFESAISLAAQGKHAEAEAAFEAIAAKGGAYGVLARLRAAAELAQRDRDGAVKRYDEIAGDASVPRPLRDLAQIRAGLLLVDAAPYDAMRARLEALAGPDGAFRHTARELLALSAWRSGNAAAARQWIDAILSDAETPPGTRARTEMLLALGATEAKS
ncbi:MAG: tetratricopeptide repeat protein [Variibacter sp.]|nr:tetratricopeptide repeat protein [Variibacter sp.]